MTALLAIIPARGGSRRIPRKNIRPLAGRPVIEYTISAALDSGLFQRVVVSTDSPEIADVARRGGAEVPFLRDARLADDHTPVSAATVAMLESLDPGGDTYGAVCQLMPNCPLRDAASVVESHGQFAASRPPAQLSVVRYGWQNPWWAFRRREGHVLEPLFPDALKARSQDLPELYCPTGATWWADAAVLRRAGTFHVDGRTGWEMPWQQGVDIDTEDDWALVETLLRIGDGT